MNTLLSFFKHLQWSRPSAFEEQYLAKSVDATDLERRLRWLDQRRRNALTV